jgi:hypothetical protein
MKYISKLVHDKSYPEHVEEVIVSISFGRSGRITRPTYSELSQSNGKPEARPGI